MMLKPAKTFPLNANIALAAALLVMVVALFRGAHSQEPTATSTATATATVKPPAPSETTTSVSPAKTSVAPVATPGMAITIESTDPIEDMTPVHRTFPPLSIQQCVETIEQILTELPAAPSADPADQTVDMIIAKLVNTSDYLDFRNDLHTSLSDYEWYYLGNGKVTNNPGQFDMDDIDVDPPELGISAIGLSVIGEDIYLKSIAVKTDEGVALKERPIDNAPILMRHSLPARFVYHLWNPTTIGQIRLTYARVREDLTSSPEVDIYGGKSKHPEYIKQAIYYLRETRLAIKAGDFTIARENLETARRSIKDYLKEEDQ